MAVPWRGFHLRTRDSHELSQFSLLVSRRTLFYMMELDMGGREIQGSPSNSLCDSVDSWNICKYRVRIVTEMFLSVGEFCGPLALYVSLCLSSRGGCELTDQQTPRLLFQVGLLWRSLEGVVKEMQVLA